MDAVLSREAVEELTRRLCHMLTDAEKMAASEPPKRRDAVRFGTLEMAIYQFIREINLGGR